MTAEWQKLDNNGALPMTGKPFIEIVFREDGKELTAEEVSALKKQLGTDGAVDPFRQLISLSDHYRTRLYDLLETVHPEVFSSADETHLLQETSVKMHDFLRRQLKQDNVMVNEDVFNMLFLDFVGSHDFFLRRSARKK